MSTSNVTNNRALFVSMGLAATAAIALYAPALRFGFFNDDPTGHFRWMEGRSIFSFFIDASGHGYYRPVSFALWQTLHALLGRHDPLVLHALNIMAHALNAALVGWLGYHILRITCYVLRPTPHVSPSALDSPSPVYGLAAGLLFALYPFSYEAVPYVGAFVHPLVTLFILLTLAFYLKWRSGNRPVWGWFAAAHITLALAVLTHENGVIAPLLILALELLYQSNRTLHTLRFTFHALRFTSHVSRFTLYVSSFLLEPLLFSVIWLLVPKTGGAAPKPTLSALAANILPFVQALIYPVAPLAQRNTVWLVIIAIGALIGLGGLAWALRRLKLLAFGVWFWLLAALPAMLLLDPAYVSGSPRLFYLGSVGAAFIWALPFACLTFNIKRSALRLPSAFYLLLSTFYLLLFTFYLLPYTACQLRYQGYAGEVGQMMAAATRAADASPGVTFINAPYFFGSRGPNTSCPQPFAFAPTGAVVIPPYADARDFAVYNGGADLPTRAVTFNEYAPGWATHGEPIDAAGLRAALATFKVFAFDLIGWQFHDVSAVWQPALFTPAAPSIATFGDSIGLEHFEIPDLESTLVVTLAWRALAAPQQDYKVSVQLLDESGQLVAQHDGMPAGGLAPTRLWQAGDRVIDRHIITMPNDWPRQAGYIIASLYDPATGARLPVIDANGNRLPNDAVVLREPDQ